MQALVHANQKLARTRPLRIRAGFLACGQVVFNRLGKRGFELLDRLAGELNLAPNTHHLTPEELGL